MPDSAGEVPAAWGSGHAREGNRFTGCGIGLGLLGVLGLAIVFLPSFFLRCERPYANGLSPEGLDPAEFDTSLLTGQPCEPPCWQGITPGQTTTDEALLILEKLTFVDAGTIRRRTRPVMSSAGERESIEWEYGSGEAMLQDDVVTTLRVSLYYDLELRDLVERFGEPTGYFVYTFPPPDAITIGPICVGAAVEFVWPEHGLSATMPFEARHPPRRSGDLLSRSDRLYLHEVTYSPPATGVLAFLLARGRVKSEAERAIEGFYRPWLGEDHITLPAYYLD